MKEIITINQRDFNLERTIAWKNRKRSQKILQDLSQLSLYEKIKGGEKGDSIGFHLNLAYDISKISLLNWLAKCESECSNKILHPLTDFLNNNSFMIGSMVLYTIPPKEIAEFEFNGNHYMLPTTGDLFGFSFEGGLLSSNHRSQHFVNKDGSLEVAYGHYLLGNVCKLRLSDSQTRAAREHYDTIRLKYSREIDE
ncbi:MAG: hypothetical protein RL557_259, partial [archaeon]